MNGETDDKADDSRYDDTDSQDGYWDGGVVGWLVCRWTVWIHIFREKVLVWITNRQIHDTESIRVTFTEKLIADIGMKADI